MRRAQWQDEGEDPDYRFSMANERTFLAWLRTSLALLAASVAVDQLLPASFGFPAARKVLAAALAVMGVGVALFAYARWVAAERAMRLSKPLGYSVSLPLLSAAMGLVGVLVLVVVIVGST